MPTMAERAHLAFGEIMDLAVGLGGTITGEHGVGRLKRPWLAGYLGPDVMELNQRIKQRIGPAGHPEPRRGDLGGRCGLHRCRVCAGGVVRDPLRRP